MPTDLFASNNSMPTDLFAQQGVQPPAPGYFANLANDFTSGVKTAGNELQAVGAGIGNGLGGIATAGQQIGNLPERAINAAFGTNIPLNTMNFQNQFSGPSNPTIQDKALQGAASFVPYAVGGLAGLPAEMLGSRLLAQGVVAPWLTGAAYNQTMNTDPTALGDATAGTFNIAMGAPGMIAHGVMGGLAGNIAPEALAANAAAAQGTNTSLGAVVGSPGLQFVQKLAMGVPFSGGQGIKTNITNQVTNAGQNLLSRMSGGVAPQDVGNILQSGLKNQLADLQAMKTANYAKVNDLADQAGLQVGRQNLGGAANNALSAINASDELSRSMPSNFVADMVNYTNPVKTTTTTDPIMGTQVTQKPNVYSLQNSNIFRSILGEKANDAYMNGNNFMGGQYAKMKNALTSDIGDAIQNVPNTQNIPANVTLFHGSPTKINSITSNNTDSLGDVDFGGVFASGNYQSALSHGDNLHQISLNENDILRQQDIDYSQNYDDVKNALMKINPNINKNNIDRAYETIMEQTPQTQYKKSDQEYLGNDPDNTGIMGWNAQAMRGQLAKELGYKAVETNDEHGTSYLVLPGTPIRPMKNSNDIDPTFGSQTINTGIGDKIKQEYDNAQNFYAQNIAPWEDPAIAKYAKFGGDPDTLISAFVKPGQTNDRGNLISSLVSKLPPEQQTLPGYAYLSRANVPDSVTGAPTFSPQKFSQLYNNVGPSTKDALFGVQGSPTRDSLDQYNNLVGMNKDILNANVAGRQHANLGWEAVAAALGEHHFGLHATAAVAGGLAGGANIANRALTSPAIRNYVVNRIQNRVPYTPGALNKYTGGLGMTPYFINGQNQ